MNKEKTLEINFADPKFLDILKALSSVTRLNLLKNFLNNNYMCQVAQKLNQTESNISLQMKVLEEAGLVNARFEPGRHGRRKFVKLNFEQIIIHLNFDSGTGKVESEGI